MRSIQQIIHGRPVSDGAGVAIRRLIGIPNADYIDPFLMFDDFRNDDPSGYIAGFPPHPHRGFETITYMVKGKMRHRDSTGNSGILEDGAVQWMTAGRGILHSEMPEQTDGSLWGFQIWLNLPKRLQMNEPRYQDIPASEIIEWNSGKIAYRLVAGELFGRLGPARTHLPVCMVDINCQGGRADIPIIEKHTAIIFCFGGEILLGGEQICDGSLAVLRGSGDIRVEGTGRCLLISSEPLCEPIARHGPFVLSNASELKQAITDYELGQLAPGQIAFLASGGHE